MQKKNIWLNVSVIAVIALILGWVGYKILDVNILSNLAKTDSEADVLNYYYNIKNSKPDEISSCLLDDKIVIFNLDGMKSRKEIADVIQEIESANPKTIILDIIFPHNSETNAEDDSYLSETIAVYQNIYTAIRISDQTVERSFFAPSPNKNEGLINETSWFQPYEVFNGDTLRYMEYAVTSVGGKTNVNRLINYSDREFDVLTVDNPIDAEDIEGQIVIVGDLGDWRDMHDKPFRMNGQWRVPGTRLFAYKLSSVLNDDWIIRLPQYLSVLIAFVLTFVFALFCRLLAIRIENEAVRNMIQLTVWTIMVIALLLTSYLVFSGCGKIISPVYAGIALSLTGIATDIWTIILTIFNKIFKIKTR